MEESISGQSCFDGPFVKFSRNFGSTVCSENTALLEKVNHLK